MKPSGARRRIVAYVEGYDDVMFWRNVLTRFENDKLYFEVMLPSRTSLAKGKKVAITNILGNTLGRNMIACVDADYDYLLQGARETSRTISHLRLRNRELPVLCAFAARSVRCGYAQRPKGIRL